MIYFDATGSVFKRPKRYSDKSAYYYAGVIECSKNKKNCPIFEILSCRHDSTRLGMLLADFKSFVVKKMLNGQSLRE